MSVYENLKEHGIELPKQLAAAGLYKPVNQAGNLVFISGQGSMVDDTKITGRVGADLSVEEGAAAARICAINTLAALEAYLGDLNRVKRCVKILGFVASTDDFHVRNMSICSRKKHGMQSWKQSLPPSNRSRRRSSTARLRSL